MSAQDQKGNGIGARIRAARGDESQEAFAKRVGITRSALANYELERTRPKREIILRIAEAAGVAPTAIVEGTVADLDELLTMLGGKSATKREADLTPDERALVRLLRACEEDTVKDVVQTIIEAFESGHLAEAFVDPATVEGDFLLLRKIEADNGRHLKGVTRDTIKQVLARLPKRNPSTTE